jgi:uncharacterized protein (DUF2384 family)
MKGLAMLQQTTNSSPQTKSDLLKDIEDIFADPEAWLNTPLIQLRGRKPIDLIGTPEEELVRNMIAAIKYGQFS